MAISAIRIFCNLNATQLIIKNSYARKWGWNPGLTDNLPSWIAAGVLGGIHKFLEVLGGKLKLWVVKSPCLSALVSPSNPCFIPNSSVDEKVSTKKLEYKLLVKLGISSKEFPGFCSHKTLT